MKNLLIVLTLPEPVRNVYRERLREAFPQLVIDMVDHNSNAGPYLEKAEAILAFGVMLSDEIFAKGRNVKWVQALGSGVDGIVDQPSFREDILVTNMQGLHGPPCAEAAICGMLDLARAMPRVLDNQRNRRWQRFPVRLLDGKKVCIIGLGVIAEALAPRCQALGMHVTGVTGTPRDLPGFDAIVSRNAMMDVVRDSDFVVLLTPYTKENHHLANADFFAAMKKDAYLVNIARGGVVDEAALIAALQDKRIAGAALDVFETEPLPEDHPLWSLDNVIVTPHLGGFHDEYPQRALPILEHNIARFLAGDIDGMINIVNRGA
ncbi:MAG: D-2-hydroxyacid dehydrogenase [Beijerinckiaceae bacterium]